MKCPGRNDITMKCRQAVGRRFGYKAIYNCRVLVLDRFN